MSVLIKEESAPILVTALLYQLPFLNFLCMYVSNFMSHVLFIIVYKLFVILLRGPQGRLVPPIGLPSVNRVYLLTYFTYSKSKREITKVTNSQNTKRTGGQPSEQLLPKRWPLSNLN